MYVYKHLDLSSFSMVFLIFRCRTKDDLNQILNESGIHESKSKSQYVARTLTGLIMAFAEEVDGLQVEVESRPETPVWDKHVNNVRIKFRRLVHIFTVSNILLRNLIKGAMFVSDSDLSH